MSGKLVSLPRLGLALLAILLPLFFAYITHAAPLQDNTARYWKDSFTDQSGIAALSNLNFSAGNLSLNDSPWFYPDHEYRKQIIINGLASVQKDYI